MRAATALSKGKRRDELVKLVVEHLKPWKNNKSPDIITAEVNQKLDGFLGLVPLHKKVFDRRPFREHARARQGSQQSSGTADIESGIASYIFVRSTARIDARR